MTEFILTDDDTGEVLARGASAEEIDAAIRLAGGYPDTILRIVMREAK